MSGTLTPKSITGRLSANLSEMSQTPITVIPSSGKKSPKNRISNESKGNILRTSLLNNSATKNAPKRTTFEIGNINKFPALKKIIMSHKTNSAFNEYRKQEEERKIRKRQEALSAVNNDAFLMFPGGLVIPVVPSKARRERRRRYVDTYYPEQKNLTLQESKMGGPRGQSKAVRDIRSGKNVCAKCRKAISKGVETVKVNGKKQHKICPEQKTYTMEGLPHNINKYYYRGNVPEMVIRSHKSANSKLYGPGVTPPKYTKFKVKSQPKIKKTGRFTITHRS